MKADKVEITNTLHQAIEALKADGMKCKPKDHPDAKLDKSLIDHMANLEMGLQDEIRGKRKTGKRKERKRELTEFIRTQLK